MNHFNLDAEKALSAFNQTHVIKLNYSYEPPFGPGKPFVTTPARSRREFAGGWHYRRRTFLRLGVSALTVGTGLRSSPERRRQPDHGPRLQRAGGRRLSGDNFDPLVDLW